MPQPRFSDIRRFCQVDRWEELRGAAGKRGDHFRFRKGLEDGRILRTKASHGDAEVGDLSLWRHIWRDQLGLEREGQFGETLASGKPVERSSHPGATPAGPSLPAWLVDALIRKVGMDLPDVGQMTEPEARDQLNEFYSQRRE